MIEFLIQPQPFPSHKYRVDIFVHNAIDSHKKDKYTFEPFHYTTTDPLKEIKQLTNISILLKDRNKKLALLNMHDDFEAIRWISTMVIKDIPFRVSFDQMLWDKEKEWDEYMNSIIAIDKYIQGKK